MSPVPPYPVAAAGGGGVDATLQIAVSPQVAGERTITFQVVDGDGAPIAERFGFDWWMSDSDAGGLTPTADGGFFNWIGVGVGAQIDSSQSFVIANVATDENGVHETTISKNAARQLYVVGRGPSGRLVIADCELT